MGIQYQYSCLVLNLKCGPAQRPGTKSQAPLLLFLSSHCCSPYSICIFHTSFQSFSSLLLSCSGTLKAAPAPTGISKYEGICLCPDPASFEKMWSPSVPSSGPTGQSGWGGRGQAGVGYNATGGGAFTVLLGVHCQVSSCLLGLPFSTFLFSLLHPNLVQIHQ